MRKAWLLVILFVPVNWAVWAQEVPPSSSTSIYSSTLSEEEKEAIEEAAEKAKNAIDRAESAAQFKVPILALYSGITMGVDYGNSIGNFLKDSYGNPQHFSSQFKSIVVGANIFPWENLGFEATIAFGELDGGFTYSQRLPGIPMLNSLVSKLGIDGRVILLKTQKIGLSLSLSGGVNYSIVSMSDQLTSRLTATNPPGFHIDGIENAFGFYTKLGMEFFAFGFLYGGLFSEISFQPNRRVNTNENLDSFYVTPIGINVGVYLY